MVNGGHANCIRIIYCHLFTYRREFKFWSTGNLLNVVEGSLTGGLSKVYWRDNGTHRTSDGLLKYKQYMHLKIDVLLSCVTKMHAKITMKLGMCSKISRITLPTLRKFIQYMNNNANHKKLLRDHKCLNGYQYGVFQIPPNVVGFLYPFSEKEHTQQYNNYSWINGWLKDRNTSTRHNKNLVHYRSSANSRPSLTNSLRLMQGLVL